MNTPSCIEDCLDAKDPVRREIVQYLIDYSEEDERLDYKADFVDDQKHWLEIVKDISAFANTFGGYLLFGIEDGTNSITGIERKTAKLLKDSNNIQQKINRNLEPPISALRAKEFRFEGKSVVCILIPRSKEMTHLISKDGEFAYPSGTKKTVLKQGTFFVRRSGGNHLGDSRDLDAVIERRIEKFQEALKGKIASVIEAPANSEVLITTESLDEESATKVVLSDSENAVPVMGMTFTKPPETAEQEIMAWRALDSCPSKAEVWKWYRERERLNLTQELKLTLFKFSLWLGAPVYFWIKDLTSILIRNVLLDAIRHRPNNDCVTEMLEVAAFLGKSPYRSALTALGSYSKRLKQNHQHFPTGGPKSFASQLQKPLNKKETIFRREQKERLDEIVSAKDLPPKFRNRWEAHRIDIYLYARDDQYKTKS